MGPSQEMYLIILSKLCLFSHCSFLQPPIRLKKQGTLTSTFFQCENRHVSAENLHFPKELQMQASVLRSCEKRHLLPWGQQFSQQSFRQTSLGGSGLTICLLIEWEKRQLKPYLQFPIQKWIQGQKLRSTCIFPHLDWPLGPGGPPWHLETAKYWSAQRFLIPSSSFLSLSYFRNSLLYIS